MGDGPTQPSWRGRGPWWGCHRPPACIRLSWLRCSLQQTRPIAVNMLPEYAFPVSTSCSVKCPCVYFPPAWWCRACRAVPCLGTPLVRCGSTWLRASLLPSERALVSELHLLRWSTLFFSFKPTPKCSAGARSRRCDLRTHPWLCIAFGLRIVLPNSLRLMQGQAKWSQPVV